MKLRFFAFIQQVAELAIALLEACARGVRVVRVWAWTRASAENLRTCNERQPRRELFN
jgi:hypothetical protein